jgi:hypothetical protein
VSAEDNIEVLGGLGSDLHKKYRVYLQYVGIATPPCDYRTAFNACFPERTGPSCSCSPWTQ